MTDRIKVGDRVRYSPGAFTYGVLAIHEKSGRVWLLPDVNSSPLSGPLDGLEVVPLAWEEGKSYHHGWQADFHVVKVFDNGEALGWYRTRGEPIGSALRQPAIRRAALRSEWTEFPKSV